MAAPLLRLLLLASAASVASCVRQSSSVDGMLGDSTDLSSEASSGDGTSRESTVVSVASVGNFAGSAATAGGEGDVVAAESGSVASSLGNRMVTVRIVEDDFCTDDAKFDAKLCAATMPQHRFLKAMLPHPVVTVTAFSNAIFNEPTEGRGAWYHRAAANGYKAYAGAKVASISCVNSHKKELSIWDSAGTLCFSPKVALKKLEVCARPLAMSAVLSLPDWMSEGWEPDILGGFVFLYQSQRSPPVLYFGPIVTESDDQRNAIQAESVYMITVRLAKNNEKFVGKHWNYKSSVFIEWADSDDSSIVELGWRNFLAQDGGSCWLEDGGGMLKLMPDAMVAPVEPGLSEIRMIDVPGKFHAWFDSMAKYDKSSRDKTVTKRFSKLSVAVGPSPVLRPAVSTRASILMAALRYHAKDPSYERKKHCSQTFAADLMTHLTGQEVHVPVRLRRWHTRHHDWFLFKRASPSH